MAWPRTSGRRNGLGAPVPPEAPGHSLPSVGARTYLVTDVDITDFYETVAQVTFTVLGLWLVAAEVMRTRDTKVVDWRLAHAVSLQLGLLGTTSLLSQIDPENTEVWRYAYGIGGLLAAALVYGRAIRGRTDTTSVMGLTAIGLVAVNVATAVVAVTPNTTLTELGSALTALEIEALLVSLLVLLAMNLAISLIFNAQRGD